MLDLSLKLPYSRPYLSQVVPIILPFICAGSRHSGMVPCGSGRKSVFPRPLIVKRRNADAQVVEAIAAVEDATNRKTGAQSHIAAIDQQLQAVEATI